MLHAHSFNICIKTFLLYRNFVNPWKTALLEIKIFIVVAVCEDEEQTVMELFQWVRHSQ